MAELFGFITCTGIGPILSISCQLSLFVHLLMILICSLSQPPRKWPVFLGRRDQGPGEPKNRTKVTMSEC